MREVQTSLGIFEGKPGTLLFAYNQDALLHNKYYSAGKLAFFTLDLGLNALISTFSK